MLRSTGVALPVQYSEESHVLIEGMPLVHLNVSQSLSDFLAIRLAKHFLEFWGDHPRCATLEWLVELEAPKISGSPRGGVVAVT